MEVMFIYYLPLVKDQGSARFWPSILHEVLIKVSVGVVVTSRFDRGRVLSQATSLVHLWAPGGFFPTSLMGLLVSPRSMGLWTSQCGSTARHLLSPRDSESTYVGLLSSYSLISGVGSHAARWKQASRSKHIKGMWMGMAQGTDPSRWRVGTFLETCLSCSV